MSELAVLGCQISITSTAGAVSATSLTPSPTQSQEHFINDKGIFFDKLTVNISGAVITYPEVGTTGTGTLATDSIDISGTASDIQNANGKLAVQKGDNGTKNCTFMFTTTTTPPSQKPVSLPVTVTVSDAGQTDVIVT